MVLPAASSPSISILISLLPKIFESFFPMAAECVRSTVGNVIFSLKADRPEVSKVDLQYICFHYQPEHNDKNTINIPTPLLSIYWRKVDSIFWKRCRYLKVLI